MTYGDPGPFPPQSGFPPPGPGGRSAPGGPPGPGDQPPFPPPYGAPPGAPPYGAPPYGAPPYGPQPTPGYDSSFPLAPGYGPPAAGWGAPIPPPPPARSSAKVVVAIVVAVAAVCAIGLVAVPIVLTSIRSDVLAGSPIGFTDGPAGELAVPAHQSGGKTYVKLLKDGKSTGTRWKTDELGFNSYSDVELHQAGPFIVVAGPSTTRAPRVVWLERSSGKVKGESTLSGSYTSSSSDGVQVPEGRTDGTVVVASRDGVRLFRPGQDLWSGKSVSDGRQVHVVGDLLFSGADTDGTVKTVKVADGSNGPEIKPDCPTDTSSRSSALKYRGEGVARVGGNEMVTVLSDGSRSVCMVRFDASTGQVTNRVRIAGKLGPVSDIVVAGDKAVAAGPLGNAAHLDLATNKVTLIENVKGVPTGKVGDVVVVAPEASSSQASAAAGIEAATGRTLWTVPIAARQLSADETEDRQVMVSGDKVAVVITRRTVDRKNYVKIVSIDPQKGPSLQGNERLLTDGSRSKVFEGPAGTALVGIGGDLYSVPLEADSAPVKRS